MFAVFVLFFLANESWFDVELTFARKGKLLYKYVMIDFGQGEFAPGQGAGRKGALVQLQEKELGTSNVSYRRLQGPVANNLEAGLMAGEGVGLGGNDWAGDDRKLRRIKEMAFQFVCLSVGLYFSTLFTSWTSIWGHTFTAVDIIDYSTIWVRFGSTVAGLIYIVVMAVRNLFQSKHYN